MGDDDRGRGTGDPLHIVVLGYPDAAVAPPLGMGGKVSRIVQRGFSVRFFSDPDALQN